MCTATFHKIQRTSIARGDMRSGGNVFRRTEANKVSKMRFIRFLISAEPRTIFSRAQRVGDNQKKTIMLVKLIRNQPQGKALFGQLYVDGEYFCDTLENTDYAIPTGFYRLRVTMSPRFRIYLPLLDGVIGRTGIRIHAGNTIDHTEGCILVGEADLPNLRLLSSLKTLHRLCDVLLNHQNHNPHEEMYIEISEPDPYPLYDVMCPPELQMP